MAEKGEKIRRKLRTVEDIQGAYEDLYARQESGELDGKSVDAANTILKGVTYLGVKLRMDAQKLLLQAAIKKVSIPPDNWPSGLLKALPDKSED